MLPRRASVHVFLGHLHRVKHRSKDRFAADLFGTPSRGLWAALEALKRCGLLSRAVLVTDTLRQNERVGASHKGLFRSVDHALDHLLRSDADEDARTAKLKRGTALAPVATQVFQKAPGVAHDGPEWDAARTTFWKHAEDWIYDAPRDDTWWAHLERAVVILLHEHQHGAVERLGAAVDDLLLRADADYPADWWDLKVPPGFDEDVLIRVDQTRDDDNPEIHYRDYDDADLVVEELDPETADPKTSTFTVLDDGRKIDEDGFLVED